MRNFTTIALKKDVYKYLKKEVMATYKQEHPDDKRAIDLSFLCERVFNYYVNH